MKIGVFFLAYCNMTKKKYHGCLNSSYSHRLAPGVFVPRALALGEKEWESTSC